MQCELKESFYDSLIGSFNGYIHVMSSASQLSDKQLLCIWSYDHSSLKLVEIERTFHSSDNVMA